MMKINLGEKIKEARLRKNLTQKELSALSGVPLNTIYRIEKGTNSPLYVTVNALCTALGISPVCEETAHEDSDSTENS